MVSKGCAKYREKFRLNTTFWDDSACLVVCSFSRVQLSATLWAMACQSPLSMGFSRQEYWSGGMTAAAASAAKLLQSCPTLCDPMGHGLPCSSVHGIPQERIMKWIIISFSKSDLRPSKTTATRRTPEVPPPRQAHAGKYFSPGL